MRVILTVVLLWSVCALGAPRASVEKQRTQEASRHFERGISLYQEARYDEALKEFQEAYRLKPHAAILYNLAQTHERLEDWAEALAEYREYLEKMPKAEDRANVERVIASLEKQLNERTLAVEGPLSSAATSPPPALDTKTPVVSNDRPHNHLWSWVSFAAAGAAVGAGAYVGSLAKSNSNSLTSGVHTQAQAQSLYSSAKTEQVTANVLYGVGSAAAALGVTLWVFEGRF